MRIKFFPLVYELSFNLQVSYSFANNSRQIIDERVIGQVHLLGNRFLFCFLSFNCVGKVNSWTVYDNLFGSDFCSLLRTLSLQGRDVQSPIKLTQEKRES